MVQQERALRTRRSLIRAAAEVFAEEGFVPASITTISRRAGVSNGALHFHFENKRALARAVEDEAAQTLRRITKGVLDAEGGALQALVDGTYGLMSGLADDIVVRAGFGLGGETSRGADSELRRYWQQWVEDMLRRAEKEGRLAQGVSCESAAPALVAATVGFEVLGGKDPQWLSEQRIRSFWDLLLPRLAEPDTGISPGSGGSPESDAPARG
ncbi:ScbR family autoregulator-binding transcription factor [Streptomyces sp. NPDC057445]|uniref:ScbR family autoregulator-binding transcription factor n=1 Tax=Streptomyces sp. NPDC057445 TaxID=3346136 RepID=UPI00369C36C3